MTTRFATSGDGARIAYELRGRGPALVLLHGAGKTRRDWQKAGYVDRLSDEFTVVAIDLRGTGDSDVLTEISDFTMEKVCEDVTAVADACEVERFLVWGYSFGGQVGKYLAARTERVAALAVIGIPLWGPAVDQTFDRFITGFVSKWGPAADESGAGNASDAAKKSAIKGRVPVWVACFQAMRSWPAIEPAGIRCPSLLLMGTKNSTGVLEWAEANSVLLAEAGVQAEVVDGLNHQQEFTAIDTVLPIVSTFLDRCIRKEGLGL